MAVITTTHLYSNVGYDESEVWCEVYRYYTDISDAHSHPGKANCIACLDAAVAFGNACAARLREIEPRQERSGHDSGALADAQVAIPGSETVPQ